LGFSKKKRKNVFSNYGLAASFPAYVQFSQPLYWMRYYVMWKELWNYETFSMRLKLTSSDLYTVWKQSRELKKTDELEKPDEQLTDPRRQLMTGQSLDVY